MNAKTTLTALIYLTILQVTKQQKNADLIRTGDVSQHYLPTPSFYVDLECPSGQVYSSITRLLSNVINKTSEPTQGKLRLKVKGAPLQTLYKDDKELIYDMLRNTEKCDYNMSNQATNNLLSVSYDVEVNSAIYVISDNNPLPKEHNPLDLVPSLLAIAASKNLKYNIFLIEKCSTGTPEFRKRRAIGSSYSFYDLLAQSTGGAVITTSHSNVGQATDLIKSQLNTNTVHILKFPFLKQGIASPFDIPVDDTITNVTVQIQTPNTTSATLAVPFIKNPSGAPAMPGSGTDVTLDTLGSRLILIKFAKPAAGCWKISKFDRNDWEVDVTAISMVDFTRKFIEPDPSGFGEFEVTGRPLAGNTYKLAITVPRYDAVKSVDKVLVLMQDGTSLQTLTLTNVSGRRGASLFNANITIPIQDFLIAIEGVDKTNHTFRRLDPKLISPLALKLEVPTKSGNVYLNETYNVTYIVYNIGSGEADIDVMVSDQDGLTPIPAAHSYTLQGKQNVTRQFLMRVGLEVGHVDTVTITAKPYLGPGKFPNSQFEIRRFTVIEHVKQPVDNTTPTCNVTKVTGTCDTGNELCKCNEKVWTMWVEIGDEGFGLQDIVTTGAGPNSSFRHDPFKPGHTIQDGKITAEISDDCCHQKATITTVDKAGNTVQCKNNLNPNFVPPDPKTCLGTEPDKIKCKFSEIRQLCNPFLTLHDPCKCKEGTWVFWAEFLKVGQINIYNIYTSNAGVNASIRRNHDMVQVEADCCHQQITVHARDIAGNSGKCEVVLNPTFKEPAPEKCDKVQPVCNVINTTSTCNLNATDLCECDKERWSMSVEIYDEYSGLGNISTVDLGSNGTFKYDRFTVGHTLKDGKITAEISGSCCNRNASIRVYDQGGNINYCNSTLAQNFAALKECDKVPPVCNVTKTTGTCNINAMDLCECYNETWSMSVEIYDEQAGLQNISAVGLESNGTFTCDKFTVGHTLRDGKVTAEISDNCCNQMAGIKVYDKSGNVYQCNSTLTQTFTAPPLPSCMTTTTSTTTSATTTTTVIPTTTTDTTVIPTTTTTTTSTASTTTITTSTAPSTTTSTSSTQTTTPVSLASTTSASTSTQKTSSTITTPVSQASTTSASTSTQKTSSPITTPVSLASTTPAASSTESTPTIITTNAMPATNTQPNTKTSQGTTPTPFSSSTASTATQTTQKTTTQNTPSNTKSTTAPETQSTSPSPITSTTRSPTTTNTINTEKTSTTKASTMQTNSTLPAATISTSQTSTSTPKMDSIKSMSSVTSTTTAKILPSPSTTMPASTETTTLPNPSMPAVSPLSSTSATTMSITSKTTPSTGSTTPQTAKVTENAPISSVAIAGLSIGSIAAVASIVTGTVLLCKAFGSKNAEVRPQKQTSESSRRPQKRRRSRNNLAWI